MAIHNLIHFTSAVYGLYASLVDNTHFHNFSAEASVTTPSVLRKIRWKETTTFLAFSNISSSANLTRISKECCKNFSKSFHPYYQHLFISFQHKFSFSTHPPFRAAAEPLPRFPTHFRPFVLFLLLLSTNYPLLLPSCFYIIIHRIHLATPPLPTRCIPSLAILPMCVIQFTAPTPFLPLVPFPLLPVRMMGGGRGKRHPRSNISSIVCIYQTK